MAYKYFSKELLEKQDKYNINLNDVFPQKQQTAKDNVNVKYGFPEIISYLKSATNDFKLVENRFVDTDSAVRTIINNYYKSKGENNPFSLPEEAFEEVEIEEGKAPKESFEVKDGKIDVVTAPRGVSKKEPIVKAEPIQKGETKAEKVAKINAAAEVLQPKGGKVIDGVFVSDYAMKSYGKDQIEEWIEAVNTILEYTTEADRTEDQTDSLNTIREYLAETE
jgi:hypothetical protein